MEKIIKFETETWIYKLDLKYVVDNRATYYANREHWEEKTEEWRKKYKEEYDYVMEDDYEWIDWLLNNTDPEDFEWNIHLIEKKESQINDWNDYTNFRLSE